MAKLAVLLAALLLASSAATGTARAGTIQKCAHYQGHVYEVCFAFAVNCTYGAMVPYLMFGRSSNAARATAASNRLESRYFGQARRKLEAMVGQWPKGDHLARMKLSILSVRSSLATNTATLRVRWSYSVKLSASRKAGEDAVRIIRMKRIRGLFLHKWVVTSIR